MHSMSTSFALLDIGRLDQAPDKSGQTRQPACLPTPAILKLNRSARVAKSSPLNTNRLNSKGMSYMDRITIEPGKCGGRPCIRGYRLRVKDVLELLANGASWEEILEDYAFLEREDIQACLDFAAAQSDHALIKMP